MLCSSSWEQLFPDSLLQSTAAGISDHCPLVLGLRDNVRGRGRFHFENFWPSLDGFQEVVANVWASPIPGICPFERLAAKFKGLTIALQSWSQKKVGNVHSQLHQARELLHQLDIAQDFRTLSDLEAWLRRRLKQHCLTLASLQRTIARVRSSISWIQKGDANTAFFHSHARFRKRKNFIAKLQADGNMVFSQEEKEQAVWDFYNGLLGTHAPRTTAIEMSALGLPSHDLSSLDLPFTEEEVWAAIKTLPSDKAPGPDGFTGRFYKECWPVIKDDIMMALQVI